MRTKSERRLKGQRSFCQLEKKEAVVLTGREKYETVSKEGWRGEIKQEGIRRREVDESEERAGGGFDERMKGGAVLGVLDARKKNREENEGRTRRRMREAASVVSA